MPGPASHERERSSAIGVLILVVAILVIAYPLSAGPVDWPIIQCGSPAWTQPYIETFYAARFSRAT